jgi:hypothetical protein
MQTNIGTWHNNMKGLFNFDILEIQQSYISEEDIITYGKDIIWLIDGNSGITIDKLSTGNYLVIFIDDWKYKSFRIYKYILISVENMIFKIELKKIKSGMIEIKEYKTLEETIRFLQIKPDNIWGFWDDDNTIKILRIIKKYNIQYKFLFCLFYDFYYK